MYSTLPKLKVCIIMNEIYVNTYIVYYKTSVNAIKKRCKNAKVRASQNRLNLFFLIFLCLLRKIVEINLFFFGYLAFFSLRGYKKSLFRL